MSGSENSIGTEERWEALGALLLAIALQVLLTVLSETRGWEVWRLPGWVWLLMIGPELALLVLLAVKDEPRETVVLALGMGAVNAFALFALIASIIGSQEHSGGQLLLKGITVWTTNVTAFAIVFWQLAHWGRKNERRQFRFPQQESGGTHWKPSFFDFFYVSFTNSIAFSPTDAMPMTRKAKLLMLVESSVSAVTVLLVAARAVNIFD
jgi:uncharacterized membrane protein